MKILKNYIFLSVFILLIISDFSSGQTNKKTVKMEKKEMITLGAGCFWCVEAVFLQADGILKVESGYMGGSLKNPTYKDICTGETGHAEVVQITFDSDKISISDILEIFWKTHDPTTLNRQGNDAGTQYRSVIFHHNEIQKNIADKLKIDLNSSGAYSKPLVTEISPSSTFYVAENYHQNYYNLNGSQPYCYFVIKPKIEKFRKVFPLKVKK
ncbi:MAG: peptide-methionine (S)-S-oxide reductase [Cytophagales bacterium]|nr:MAG: peptide-methionine (S)-S-oxide reductase [Cytophagales bacterium]